MSKYNLTDALNNVELVYSDIVDIANEMLDQIFEPINSLIDEIRNSGANSSTESIRGFMFRLQLKSFEISDTKEKSALKAMYIPTESNIIQGDSIETSGLGGIYPKGIHVGTVKKVVTSQNIIDRYAIIETAVDFDKLDSVLVITNK